MKKGGFWERLLHVVSGLKLVHPTCLGSMGRRWSERDSWNDGRQPEPIGMARRETVAGFRH